MLLFVGRREIEGAVKVIWGVDPKHVWKQNNKETYYKEQMKIEEGQGENSF
jgi:hypothetical protein